MKYGTRNNILSKVRSIMRDEAMSLVKLDITNCTGMASVLISESVDILELAVSYDIQQVIKAFHVLTVKE